MRRLRAPTLEKARKQLAASPLTPASVSSTLLTPRSRPFLPLCFPGGRRPKVLSNGSFLPFVHSEGLNARARRAGKSTVMLGDAAKFGECAVAPCAAATLASSSLCVTFLFCVFEIFLRFRVFSASPPISASRGSWGITPRHRNGVSTSRGYCSVSGAQPCGVI